MPLQFIFVFPASGPRLSIGKVTPQTRDDVDARISAGIERLISETDHS